MAYKDKELEKKTRTAWRLANKDKELEYQKKSRRNRRLKVLEHYSNGTMACACCGELNYEFLAVDHINGGGTKHIKEIGENLDRWLIRNGFPKGFRILCHNCNQALGLYGYCPHNRGIS